MKPHVNIEFGDKTYQLRFNFQAMCDFEDITGLMLIKNDYSTKTTIKKLWVMMKQQEPDLTYEQVVKLIDDHPKGMNYVIDKTLDAILAGTVGRDPNAQTPAAKKNPNS
jgi:hypothetical protein